MRVLIKILVSISLFSSIAISNQNFDNRIGEIVDKIDKRISLLNRLKRCVQNAQSGDELKVCRGEHKEALNRLKAEYRNSHK